MSSRRLSSASARLPHLGGSACRQAFTAEVNRLPPRNHSRFDPRSLRPAEQIKAGTSRASRLRCRADASKGVAFPAGRRQARVELPACFVSISVEDAINDADKVGAAVSAGANGVLLVDEADAGAADLYEAAVQLKSIIRGRACLLITDRTDIANAAEADGVALSPKGLPTIVARRMLKATEGLIASVVTGSQEAKIAAKDGANLIILSNQGGAVTSDGVTAARTEQGSSGGIPIVASVSNAGEASALRTADGVVLNLAGLDSSAASAQVGQALQAFLEEESADDLPEGPTERERKSPGLKHFLDEPKEALLDSERAFLKDGLAFLQEAVPDLEELGLMTAAIKQLDELFLMVVVGEFNSGKSSIINALLGGRFLAQGILPTTNEISVIKFSQSGQEELVQDADGIYIRKLPAELLRDVNIVDTPGTNVIVDRQQRLTEEYVPRADLVLFCMSADRPFTESETNFLKYIRQWGKKVVFVVNKVDILANDGEVKEVVQFVGDNATRLLGVERSQVLPVSARAALEAKVSIGGGSMAGGILSAEDARALQGNPQWESSRFGRLESFILDFLVGGASAGETVRLKLQTPLFVSEALLASASERLQAELDAAREDVEAVVSVQQQLKGFKQDMGRDGAMQRNECAAVISGAVQSAQNLVDSTLQLANLDGLSTYLFGSSADPSQLPLIRSFRAATAPAAETLERLVEEHSNWLRVNCDRQLNNYRNFAQAKAEQLGVPFQELEAADDSSPGNSSSEASADDAEERRRWRESRSADKEASTAIAPAGSQEGALTVVRNFDANAGAVLLEEEVREAVIGTAGAAVGAGFIAILSTFVLPTTLEDFLALALGGLIGYTALLNLPLRRDDANRKLSRVATGFLKDVDEGMEKELSEALDGCIESVNAFVLPLQKRCEAEVARLEGHLSRLRSLEEELRSLKQQAANIE